MSGPGPREHSTELPMTDLSATPGTDDGDPLIAAIAKTALGPPPPDLEAGAIVGHGFRVDRKLGSGGMGVVYLAHDMTLDRAVAIKVHRAHGGLDRLQREAIAMARLQHPNVITVHEIGRIGDRLFVAMEYVAGKTLRDWLQEAPRGWREVVAMMRQVGQGLCAAHDAGLVHRDFKPENVLVGPDGRPRVGDFGLVRVVAGTPSLTTSEIRLARSPAYAMTQLSVPDKPAAKAAAAAPAPDLAHEDTIDSSSAESASDAASDTAPDRITKDTGAPVPRRGPDSKTLVPAEISTVEPDADRLTATGAVLGTPAYMAPEQFAGEQVDTRADQFAFSVVLYECLYGQRPFAGHTHGEILRSIEAGAIRPAPSGRRAPRWLRRVIERGLACEPHDRFPNLRALLAALERGTRRPVRVAVAAIAAIAIAAAIGVYAGRGASDAASPCATAGDELDAMWTPAARARLADDARKADPALGARIADTVASRLDSATAGYRDAAHRACVARDVDRTWDDDLYHRSHACLGAVSDDVRHLLSLQRASRRDLGVLIAASASLSSAELCKRPSVLAGVPAFGHGLVTGDLSAGMYDRLSSLQHGNVPLEERMGQLATVEKMNEMVASPTISARIELLRAGFQFQRDDLATAQATAERAYQDLRSNGDDANADSAAVLLVRILGVEQNHFDAARSWLLQALAGANRDPVGGYDAYLAAAAMAEKQVHPDEAIDFARKAVAQLDAVGETTDAHYAFALDQLAAALDEGGHSAESVPIYQKAIALNQQLGGPDNPALFNDYTNSSLALVAVGDSKGAVDAARHALTLAQQWSGVLSADTMAAAWLNLGAAYQGANQHALAEEALEAARAGYRALPGDQRESLAIVEADLALAHRVLGKTKDAETEIQDALALYRELGAGNSNEYANAALTLADLFADEGRCKDSVDLAAAAVATLRRNAPDDAAWVNGQAGMGQCLRELGRAAEALDGVEAALAQLATHPHAKHIEADVRFQIARDLHELGRDPTRAHQLAAEARALYVTEDPNVYAKEIRFIDDVLATWR